MVSPQCPLQEMAPQPGPADLLPALRSMALADRAVFEKGVRAFVSHVQAYAKHECSLIFRLKGEPGPAPASPSEAGGALTLDRKAPGGEWAVSWLPRAAPQWKRGQCNSHYNKSSG